jgi:hypothetical protein
MGAYCQNSIKVVVFIDTYYAIALLMRLESKA